MASEYQISAKDKGMTLAEYLNQETPKRLPVVYLEKTDFRIVHEASQFVVVEIPILYKLFNTNAVYIKQKDGTFLWTMDEDGNKKHRSCFRITSN